MKMLKISFLLLSLFLLNACSLLHLPPVVKIKPIYLYPPSLLTLPCKNHFPIKINIVKDIIDSRLNYKIAFEQCQNQVQQLNEWINIAHEHQQSNSISIS